MQTLNLSIRRGLPTLVIATASLFYVYEFFLRVAPSALSHELMLAFKIDAGGLGLLSASFFYGYMPMQIPAGMLGDQYGPRKLLTIAAVICGFAILAFSLTQNIYIASVARFYIGLASAFAYIGPLIIARRWFPAKRFVLISGLIQMMGCFGAVIGGAPIAILSHLYGWRLTLMASAAVGAVIAVLFWAVIRDHPDADSALQHAESNEAISQKERFKRVCHNGQSWAAGITGFACWTPIVVFAALWGVPFLMTAYSLTSIQAAGYISWIWLGIAAGGPMLGWWSDHIRSRKTPLIIGLVGNIILTSMILFMPHLPGWLLGSLLCLLGFTSSSQAVTFGVAGDNHTSEVAGTAVGFNNMAVIAGGFLIQPLVGMLLRLMWSHKTTAAGVPIYSSHAYHWALAIIPVCAIIGLFTVIFWVKETHCEPAKP